VLRNKILLLDIETSPNIVHVWGLWNQNVAINQVITPGGILCWAAKYVGHSKIYFDSIAASSETRMLKSIHKLMDETDIICHYNGTDFDIPTLNREFIKAGMKPPSPYKQMDLLLTIRKRFRFPSNKLEYISRELGIGKKIEHGGHELWIKCMAKKINRGAWALMKKYNIHDVRLLERLYNEIKPWIIGHVNLSGLGHPNCPRCSSRKVYSQGEAVVRAGIFTRYQCQKCGGWFRSAKPQVKFKKDFIASY